MVASDLESPNVAASTSAREAESEVDLPKMERTVSVIEVESI